MARINFPETILGWINLFKTVKPKVLALPTPTSVDSYMTENSVDLTADETAVNSAEPIHNEAAEKERTAERHTEAGNILWNRCDKDHHDCVQNLKTIYRNDVRKLGEWGVNVDGTAKIVYKSEPAEHAIEMQALITKHNSYIGPAVSPLKGFLNANPEVDLAQNALDIVTALGEFAAADTAHGKSEEKNEACWNLLMPVIEHLRGIGQAAIKMYARAPHMAGDLGFTIDASKQPAKTKTVVMDAAQKTVYKRLDVGSVLYVKEGSIAITPSGKRKLLRGTRSIVNKGEKFVIQYGFGSAEIENLKSDSESSFDADFHN